MLIWRLLFSSASRSLVVGRRLRVSFDSSKWLRLLVGVAPNSARVFWRPRANSSDSSKQRAKSEPDESKANKQRLERAIPMLSRKEAGEAERGYFGQLVWLPNWKQRQPGQREAPNWNCNSNASCADFESRNRNPIGLAANWIVPFTLHSLCFKFGWQFKFCSSGFGLELVPNSGRAIRIGPRCFRFRRLEAA